MNMSDVCEYCDHIKYSKIDYITLICELTNKPIIDPMKEHCNKYTVMDYAF